MLNIKTKAVTQTGDLHLRDANDELMFDENGEKVTITLYGPGSREHAAAITERQNRSMNRLKAKGKVEQSVDDRLAEQSKFFASITASFNNFNYPDAGTGPAMFTACYADPEVGFITDQVASYVGDWANFSKASPTT